jgi:hypothetical protein
MKTKKEAGIDNEFEISAKTDNKIKVKFHNTYMGGLGSFYSDNIYELTAEIYEMLKMDCEKLEN